MRERVLTLARLRSQASTALKQLPLSGFRKSEVRGHVSCRTRSWACPPSETSPHKDRAPLSRPLAPLRLSVCLQRRTAATLLPSVSFPRLSPKAEPVRGRAARGFPRRLWVPFRTPRELLRAQPSFSRSPWITAAKPSRSADFIRFEALIPLRVRSRAPELPRAHGRSSLGMFAPLQTFLRPCPRPSDPRKPLQPSALASRRTLKWRAGLKQPPKEHLRQSAYGPHPGDESLGCDPRALVPCDPRARVVPPRRGTPLATPTPKDRTRAASQRQTWLP